MTLELAKLDMHHADVYEELLNACPWAMVYHTMKFRHFLKEFLPSSASDHYLLAFDDSTLVGALPTFIMNGPFGPVLNSLPFFGSHGSILLKPNANSSTSEFLAEALLKLCHENKVTFATIIDTPFTNHKVELQRKLEFQYFDQRIGQLTSLPSEPDSKKVGERVFSILHTKTRNLVRKGLSNDFEFGYNQTPSTLENLLTLHETNILGIGGIPKPKKFFDSIAMQFEPDTDYRIYTARTKQGEIVCALMLLYFKDIVEYFVPATAKSWRSAQPLSALIYLSMCDAIIERKAKIWNWGGTWLSQDGVYHFKSRWGTTDHPYDYFTRVFPNSERLQGLTRQTLQQGYPWFYSIPFSELVN